MSDWRKALAPTGASIRETIRIIEDAALQIALVVDEGQRLLGIVTDGDVRRGILQGISLDEPVSLIMNTRPSVARTYEDPKTILSLMKVKYLHQMPVLDEEDRLVGILTLDEMIKTKERSNWVVLMAGGLGTRLAPLTDHCPKPLLKVGGKPLLETILEQFIEHGFRKFFFAVNYKAEMVIEHFGDGSHWGVEIEYLHEQERLGTAGALSLLPYRPKDPLLVMNGDLLTKVNFAQLLDTHLEQQADATMGVREYNFQVPYGVVRIDRNCLVGIDEKPVQRFFVSAGIYVLNPEVLDLIPSGEATQMPYLFDMLIERNYGTRVFPIREYWLDIGHMEDFKRANGEYAEVFQ